MGDEPVIDGVDEGEEGVGRTEGSVDGDGDGFVEEGCGVCVVVSHGVMWVTRVIYIGKNDRRKGFSRIYGVTRAFTVVVERWKE